MMQRRVVSQMVMGIRRKWRWSRALVVGIGWLSLGAAALPVAAAPIPISGSGSATGSPIGPVRGIAEDGLCTLVSNKTTGPALKEHLNTGGRAQYVNLSGLAGVTPLMVAAFQGHTDAVNVLLDFGADTEIESVAPRSASLWRTYFESLRQVAGLRAIDFAILGGHPDVIVSLIDRSRRDPTLPRASKEASSMPIRTPDGHLVSAQETKLVTLEQRIEQSMPVVTARSQEAAEESKALIRSAIQSGVAKRNERLLKYRQQFPLEARLSEQLVGQQPAIHSVSSAIRRKENGWVDSESPLVMLFMGSSGIGKTKTAKLIGEYLHGSEDKEKLDKCFIRVDMSEFQHKHEVSKFIGSPPGYVGYEAGGQLVSKLEKCPGAVVLLDEVEKAHPDVLTVMLQAFDEGRLTDGKGKTIDCSDAVFVLTSNLAQREIADEAVRLRQVGAAATGEAGVEAGVDPLTKAFKRDVVQPILRRHFGRDEFIGRINEIIFFLPFSEEEQRLLANKELEAWAKRAKAKQGITLTWTPEVCAVAAEEYDLRYGARSIKYEIDRMCIAPIARAQEAGVVKPGCRIHIDVDHRTLAQFREMAAECEVVRQEMSERDRKQRAQHYAPKLPTGLDLSSPVSSETSKTDDEDPKRKVTPPSVPWSSVPHPEPLPGANLYRSGKVALSVFLNEANSGSSGFKRLLGLS